MTALPHRDCECGRRPATIRVADGWRCRECADGGPRPGDCPDCGTSLERGLCVDCGTTFAVSEVEEDE